METIRLEQWKKFELKKLVAEMLPPDEKNEYSFARRLIFAAWEHYSIKDVQFALEHYFPEQEKAIKAIILKRKMDDEKK